MLSSSNSIQACGLKTTSNGFGTFKNPNSGSKSGFGVSALGQIWNFWKMLVRNRNNVSFAKDSPKKKQNQDIFLLQTSTEKHFPLFNL